MDESNEMTATAVEEAPAEKPEKPKRAPRAKKANGNAAAAAPPPPVEAEEPPAPVAVPVEEEHEPVEVLQKTPAAETLDIRVLKEMKLPDLTRVAKELGVENATGMRKQDLIFSIRQAQREKSGLIFPVCACRNEKIRSCRRR